MLKYVVKIVILHGWGHNKKLWSEIVSKFGNDALAYDLPGFGAEPIVDDNWGVDEYVDWVHNKISKFDKVVLVGHSFGGRVAAKLASRESKNVVGLVLAGAPCLYRPKVLTKAKIFFSKVLRVFFHEDFKSLFYSHDLKKSGKLKKIFRNVVNYDQKGDLEKISVPTLILWGENDDSVSTTVAKEMSQIVKNSKIIIIENTGHNLFLENPNIFYGAIKNFISNL